MGQLVFQATLGGQVNLVGPNTASTFNLNVPAIAGTLVTTGDTGTVTSTMLATAVYTAPGTIGSGTPNTGAFTTLSGSTSVTTPILKSASSLTFQTNGTTTAVTIDTSQNVGVGTTSPYKSITVGTSDATAWITAGGSDVNLTLSSVGTAGAVVFRTGGTNSNPSTTTERARIDSSGNLLVGTTSTGNSNSKSFVANVASGFIVVNHLNGQVSGSGYASFGYNGGEIGSITQSGTTAVLYNLTSDQRLKENIADAASSSSLIDAIQVRQYDWKSDGSHQRYGFIAQELVTVAPEAVHQPADPEAMMAVDYSKLVPMLVKEIQSLRQRVAQLESN